VVPHTEDCLEAMAILIEEGISVRPERLEQAAGGRFLQCHDVADYLVSPGGAVPA